MALPYVITILVTDGQPEGARVVEKSNWTGRGLVFSRADLAAAIEQGLATPGIYVLIGDDPDEQFEHQIYVGQGEDVGKRLKQHQGDDNKEFWNDTVVFVSGNESLNRAHISHLESSLIRLATDAKRALLVNGNQPADPRMAASDTAVADGFLAEMLAIFPVLGVTAFDLPTAKASVQRRRYFLAGPDTSGEGEERSDGFFVYAGALARIHETPSLDATFKRLRDRLVSAGTLQEADGCYHLTEDTLFSSPSSAAAALLGRSANGRTEWKDADSVALKDRQIQEASGARS